MCSQWAKSERWRAAHITFALRADARDAQGRVERCLWESLDDEIRASTSHLSALDSATPPSDRSRLWAVSVRERPRPGSPHRSTARHAQRDTIAGAQTCPQQASQVGRARQICSGAQHTRSRVGESASLASPLPSSPCHLGQPDADPCWVGGSPGPISTTSLSRKSRRPPSDLSGPASLDEGFREHPVGRKVPRPVRGPLPSAL